MSSVRVVVPLTVRLPWGVFTSMCPISRWLPRSLASIWREFMSNGGSVPWLIRTLFTRAPDRKTSTGGSTLAGLRGVVLVLDSSFRRTILMLSASNAFTTSLPWSRAPGCQARNNRSTVTSVPGCDTDTPVNSTGPVSGPCRLSQSSVSAILWRSFPARKADPDSELTSAQIAASPPAMSSRSNAEVARVIFKTFDKFALIFVGDYTNRAVASGSIRS